MNKKSLVLHGEESLSPFSVELLILLWLQALYYNFNHELFIERWSNLFVYNYFLFQIPRIDHLIIMFQLVTEPDIRSDLFLSNQLTRLFTSSSCSSLRTLPFNMHHVVYAYLRPETRPSFNIDTAVMRNFLKKSGNYPLKRGK